MKNLTKTICAVLAAGLVSSALCTREAQATPKPINGTIDFAGSVRFDTNSLATATQITEWRDVFGHTGFTNVAATTGDFSGISLGTQATMATWIFNPSTATPGLWSVGGFTFDLLSSTIVTQNATFLNISGRGTVSDGNGFFPTAMSWAFTVPNAGGNHKFFSFSANVGLGVGVGTHGVPDGGPAVVLLGIGLWVIEFIRRKVRRRACQQKQIEALTAVVQKVSAQLEATKPAPQVVAENP